MGLSAIAIFTLDLDLLLADGEAFLLGAADGVAQVEEDTFASHLQNAEAGAAGGPV